MSTMPPAVDLAAQLPAALRECFAAQRAAFAKNRNPGLAERRADLRALHRLLVENRDALVDAVNRDFGCRSRFETLMTELLQGQEAALDAIRQLPRWMNAILPATAPAFVNAVQPFAGVDATSVPFSGPVVISGFVNAPSDAG